MRYINLRFADLLSFTYLITFCYISLIMGGDYEGTGDPPPLNFAWGTQT